MNSTRLCTLLALVAIVGAPISAHAGQGRRAHGHRASAAPASSCNRRCLLQVLTDYTEALTDNDVLKLAVAPTIRVTSNGTVTTLGKGEVWGAGRRLPYRQAYVDPITGAAVFYGAVTNAITSARPGARVDTSGAPTKWWFYVVRLKILGRQITEVEEVSYERPAGGFGMDASALTLPDRIFDTVLPLPERSSRSELFEIADKYFDAVSQKLNYRQVPWHPECQRIELGVFTVNAERSPGS